MRITVSMPSTGLVYAPGLARPLVIETDKLPTAVADKLSRLVEEARLFDQPEAVQSPQSDQLRDAQEMTITVEADGKQRTLHVADPIGSITKAALRDFVQLVREQAALLRRKDKPE